MEGHVNHASAGEPGNRPPPIRRRPTAPQPRGRGFAVLPQQPLGGRELRPTSLGRKPMPSQQPWAGPHIPVYAHQDDGCGHELGYGNMYNEQQGQAIMPHHHANPNPNSRENGQYQDAEGNHYNGTMTDQYHQAGYGVAHPNYDASQQAEVHDYGPDNGDNMYNAQQGHAIPHRHANPNPNSKENGQYQYADGNHYDGTTTDQYHQAGYGVDYDASQQAGYGVAHPNYDPSQQAQVHNYGPDNGDRTMYGRQPHVKSSGYGVVEQNVMLGQENQPSEKCMQCVHGIAVPVARLST